VLSSYVDTCEGHCCWCWRGHIVLIVYLVNVKQNFCILRLQCSVNGLLLLVLACFRRLRSSVGFVLALSAWLLVLLLLSANLTGLAFLVLLEAEHSRFGSACCSNFRPKKWLKPIARYLRLNQFDQRSAFLVISDRGAFWVSTFTSGTFIWCSSLWLTRIPCSGTCVTTTCFWRLLRHTVNSCVTQSFGFELLALPSVALFFDWWWIKNNPKRL